MFTILQSRSLPVFLALAALAGAGGGCTKAARTNRAIDRADRLFQAGDYSKAEVAYSNACRIAYPPSPRALRQLGFVFVQEGRSTAALGCLLAGAKAEPDNARIQVDLATIWAQAGRATEAKDAARHALKLLPGNEEALMALCDVIHSPEDAAQTRHYIEQLQKQDQDRASYHLALGLIDGRETNMAAAESEFNKARSLDPKSAMVYVALARLAAFHNNLKGADQAYKTAVELSPLRSPVRLVYAEFQVQTGATNQARTNMMELSRQAPDYLPPLVFLMRLSFGEGKLDQCNSEISQVLAHEPYNYEALHAKGEVSLAKKDGKQAVADFERLVAQNPKDPRPQVPYQLAMAYALNGNRTKALSSLNHSLELDTNFVPAKLMLAELNMRQGNPVAAISLLSPLLKQSHLPPKVLIPASLILAQSYLMQNSLAPAIDVYRRMEELYPEEAQLPYLEGQAYETAHKMADARAAFEKSLVINSNHLPALEELVNLDLYETRYDQALQRVKKFMDRDTNAPLPWLLQAEIHLRQKANALAQADLETVINLNPKLPLPYLMLARLYVDQHQQKQALDKLNALVSLTNSVSALFEIGMIHDQLGEFDPARQSYEKVLGVDPHFAGALNNLAYLYSERFNELDKAYKFAERDRELSPYDPYVADTLGWILYRRHEYPRALALLQESLDKQPGNGEVRYHVGMTHYMLGEEDSARLELKTALAKADFDATNDALRHLNILELNPAMASAADRAVLEKDIEKDPSDPIALNKLGVVQEHGGEFEKAGATYEKVVKLTPENARALIRLAILDSTKLNQPKKGLDLAQNAHNLAPDDPFISETLGRLVFQAGLYPRALILLQSAARLLPGQPDLLHDLAWAYFSTGDEAEARASMSNAVQTGAPFDKLDDAKKFNEMMAVCANPAQAQAAARVQQVLQADTNYAPAFMALGRVDEQQGKTQEAEQSYQKVLAAYPLFVPAARQLAILYARDGADDAKASEYAAKAASAFAGDAELAKAVGQVEYRRKNYSKSLLSLNQSAQKMPGDAELLYYQGMDYFGLKQTNDAKNALLKAVSLKLPEKLDTEARRVLSLIK